jgi:hypothetical protein
MSPSCSRSSSMPSLRTSLLTLLKTADDVGLSTHQGKGLPPSLYVGDYSIDDLHASFAREISVAREVNSLRRRLTKFQSYSKSPLRRLVSATSEGAPGGPAEAYIEFVVFCSSRGRCSDRELLLSPTGRGKPQPTLAMSAAYLPWACAGPESRLPSCFHPIGM